MGASDSQTQNSLVLVLGGGVAGQRAAADLARAGSRVLLIERETSLGGTVARLGAMFPQHNCLLCRGSEHHGPGCTRPTLSPELLDFGQPSNLTVWTRSELVALDGGPGSWMATILRHPRYVDTTRCINCDRCAQVCPQEVPDAHQADLVQRKAAYRPAFRAVPNAYAIDKGPYCLECNRCEAVCPTGAIDLSQEPTTETVPVSAVVLATGMELYDAALSGEFGYGRYPNVLTGFEMERMTSPDGPGEGAHIVRRSDGAAPKRIAWLQCVGSRDEEHDYCSSFCCGYATRQAVLACQSLTACETTIYLMDDRVFAHSFIETYAPLRKAYGIRLSRNRPSTLREDPETGDILVQIRSEDGTISEERHDMVVLSVGSGAPRGTEGLATILGLETDRHGFLRTSALAPVDSPREGIFVAGALAAPVDVADAVTQGAAAAARVRAFLDYPEAEGDHATPSETDREPLAPHEARIGVFACDCAGEVGGVVDLGAILSGLEQLEGVELAEMIPFGCLPEGLARMRQLVQEYRLTGVVVGACVQRTYGLLFARELSVPIEFASLREGCAYVHGDDPQGATRKARGLLRAAVARLGVHDEPSPLVVEPVREALVVGGGLAGLTAALHLADGGVPVHLVERGAELGGIARRMRRRLDGQDMAGHLGDLIQRVRAHPRIHVYTRTVVARRIGRQGSFVAQLRSASGRQSESVIHAGALIVATGGQEYRGGAYGLGESDAICTLLDLGERLHAKPEFASGLKQVVFISCVGPWDEETSHAWRCSRTCCEGILTYSRAIKAANPACQVVVLHREINAYALKEEHYTKARRDGVLFVRFDPDEPPLVEWGEEGPRVLVKEQTLDEILEFRPDVIALAAATLPQQDAKATALALDIPQASDGFFRDWEAKTRSFGSLEPGVYLCGLDQGPKPGREAIAQALAAADQALTYLTRERLVLDGPVASVDRRQCMACLTCVRVCPYQVPRMSVWGPGQSGSRAHSVIDPARCQGCGTCVADCPGKAISMSGYSDERIMVGQTMAAQRPV